MGIIGNNTVIGGANPRLPEYPQNMLQYAAAQYTPAAAEEVFEVSVHAGNTLGGTLEIGVYDITSGIDGATLIGSVQLTTDTASDWNTQTIASPWQLTSGNTYAIAQRAITEVVIYRAYAGSATSNNNLDGTSPLSSTWTDSGSANDDFSIYAATRAAAPSGPDYTQRKGSTFDVTHGLGTITSATLDGNAITINSTGAGTVNLTDDSGITTSGEYDLVLGDGVGTETYTVQVNVVGIETLNLNQDGSDIANVSDVSIRMTKGAGVSGDLIDSVLTGQSTTTGNLGPIYISDETVSPDDTINLAFNSPTNNLSGAPNVTVSLL